MSALTVLALASCSSSTEPVGTSSSSSGPAHRGASTSSASVLLSSAELNKRLLNESDLGEGYTRKPEPALRHDDVTVIGCPVLEKFGSDAATGSGLDFPRKEAASFVYADNNSEVAEELYSGAEDKLSQGVSRIFGAMSSCPRYQLLVGSTPVTVTTRKLPAPKLGEERWSQLLTFTVGGRSSVVKQTAVRTGTVVVVVSGSAALVDAHVAKATDKAHGVG
nr:hypothetical protein [Streptomyces sp. S3(2020)]